MPDRTQLLAEVDSLLHRQGTFTKEDSAKVESLLRLADQLTDRGPLRAAVSHQREIELGRMPQTIAAPDAKFLAYLRLGPDALEPEERRKLGSERKGALRAAQTTSPGSAGGYLVPQSFADRFQMMMKLTDEIFAVATLWESATGTISNYPLVDDTGNEAAVIVEANASNSGPDVSFAAIAFGACPMWRTGLVTASVELVQDSAFNLEAMLASIGGVRMARGAGAAAMATLRATAPVGITTASPTAIAPDEVFGLVDAQDVAYGSSGASFLMARPVLTAIQQLKATTNSYIFPPDRDASGRQNLCGFPVYISPSGDPLTAGKLPISFGRHDLCVRRDVRGSLMHRVLFERYAEFGKVGYESYLRSDFAVPISTTGSPSVTSCPIRLLAMHS